MANTEKREKIVESIQQILESKGLNPTNDTPKDSDHFRNDLGLDSLDEVELVMEVEKEHNLAIPDSEMERLDTFGKLVDYVTERVS